MMSKARWASLLLLGSLNAQAELSLDVRLDYELSAYGSDRALTQLNSHSNTLEARSNQSYSVEMALFDSWDDGAQSLSFKQFYRNDQMDESRSFTDVRELLWTRVADDFELNAGIGKVYWGVTETAHLVDIINQTDGVESIDGEQKLGQPMFQMLFERDWGNLDIFVMPVHRERTFAGPDARLSVGAEYSDAIYEAAEDNRHVDVAARWSHYWDDFEYAISAFKGTSREPNLGAQVDSIAGDTIKVLPYYPLITQLGLEFQYLNEGWAWKFEGIYRDGMLKNTQVLIDEQEPISVIFIAENGDESGFLGGLFDGFFPSGLLLADKESYYATVAGFEFTQVGLWDSSTDLGWVVEHAYDSRQNGASLGAFEHDVFFANRWVANDDADSTLLVGVLYDYEYEDYSFSLEGNTRLFSGLSLTLEARVFEPVNGNPQYAFRDEDFVKLTFSYYL